MKSKITVLSLVVLAFIAGCKAHQSLSDATRKQLPLRYTQEEADSVSQGGLPMSAFIDDSLLMQLIDTALNLNPDLLVSLQRMAIAKAQVRAAKGALLPRADLALSGAVRRFGLFTMDGAGNAVTDITPGRVVPVDLPDLYAGVTASWEVDIWGRLRNLRKASLMGFLASAEGMHLTRSELVSGIAELYYELVAADFELEVIRETIVKQEEALNVLILQKEAARANELAVQQFNAQLLDFKSIEADTRQRVIELENALRFLTGHFNKTIERTSVKNWDFALNDIQIGVPAQLIEHRPDIRRAEFELSAVGLEVAAARKAFYPGLNILGGYGYQAFDPSLWFQSPASIAYTAFGGLFTPILNRNAIKARWLATKANQEIALQNYRQTLLTGYLEVSNSTNAFQNLRQVKLLKREQSELLIKAVSTSRELYKSARANYVELLLAQQNSLKANLEYIDAAKRFKKAQIRLYKALGGGWR